MPKKPGTTCIQQKVNDFPCGAEAENIPERSTDRITYGWRGFRAACEGMQLIPFPCLSSEKSTAGLQSLLRGGLLNVPLTSRKTIPI